MASQSRSDAQPQGTSSVLFSSLLCFQGWRSASFRHSKRRCSHLQPSFCWEISPLCQMETHAFLTPPPLLFWAPYLLHLAASLDLPPVFIFLLFSFLYLSVPSFPLVFILIFALFLPAWGRSLSAQRFDSPAHALVDWEKDACMHSHM